ncbi:MAG: aminotransferase class I/II-fold pyridoxal phosphate-dependent enzyme [Blastochloris sp.]|nr:aminotransferase class I/II-fold pyridoxal phosphate-dependent enzyme [Blastochloris sp.]
MHDLLADRVAGFGTSIFSEITNLAIAHKAVNLGQGFPDFAGPDFVKQAAAKAIHADLNQYAPSPGLPRLRKAIAAQWERLYERAVDWQTEITVTSGATEALANAALALCNPGDKVIMFEPAYDSYVPNVTLAGAIPLPVRLHPPDWQCDPVVLRAAFEQRPRAIWLNTPHNPTGKVFRRDELMLLAELCQQYDVVALSDEVYDQLLFNDAVHVPLASLPGMWERTLTINSIGKTFSVTGWKIGYAVGPKELNHALRQSHQWVTFATATPLQDAAATALEQAAVNGYYNTFRQEYDERRMLLERMLTEVGLSTLAIQGSYFLNADISALGFTDDRAFCRFLTTEIGVAAIPTSAFYIDQNDVPPLARFCFAKRLETLAAGGERLQRLKS